MGTLTKLARFNKEVLSKYQIYNSIFVTLPFERISKTGVLLPLFHETCVKGFDEGKDPNEMGFEKFNELLFKAQPLTTADLMRKRLSLS